MKNINFPGGSTPRYYTNRVESEHLDKIMRAVQDYGWPFRTACSWQGHEPEDIKRALQARIK